MAEYSCKSNYMRKVSYVLPVFLISLCLTLFVIFLGSRGVLRFVTDSMQIALFPVGTLMTQFSLPVEKKQSDIDSLRQENARLTLLLAQKNVVEQENQALRDQFDTTDISSKTLLPVAVVGMPGVIPNVSFPETLIINAGTKEGIQKGLVLVVKNQIVGIVKDVTNQYAQVQLITSQGSTFSVRTTSGAIGVAKGQGNGEIIVDNILLSDTVVVGDTIFTLGNQNLTGVGYEPNLVVGKVVSVEKNSSSLFQKARVIPLSRFDLLRMVFVKR